MSTQGSGLPRGSVTMDHLIALNDEMAALIRAGVPLERGLVEAGRELQGRLGSLVEDLGERLGRGERLPEALAGSRGRIPTIYRAVVEAGLRSGRLAEALENMGRIARSYAEMRSTIALAMLYPLVVFLLAYGLALFFIYFIAPMFTRAFDVLGLPPMVPLNRLAEAGNSVAYWGPILPALVVILALVWLWSGRSASLESGILAPLFRRLPIVRSIILNHRAANFADLLALLVEHHVPLDAAVELAGEASGDRSFQSASHRVAEAIRSGRTTVAEPRLKEPAIPPLLDWILSGGGRGDLAPALRHTASNYRRKAEYRSRILRSVLPTFFLLTIGLGAVILYALLLFVPLMTLWDQIAMPVNR